MIIKLKFNSAYDSGHIVSQENYDFIFIEFFNEIIIGELSLLILFNTIFFSKICRGNKCLSSI